jgi:hypothetical protein
MALTKPFFAVLLCCCLSGCGTVTTRTPRVFRARITFYRPGEDRYGVRTASGHRAHEGRTIAAGWWAPYGLKVMIARLKGVVGNGNFVVEDRGRDVERMKASKGTLPVVDVFVASRAKYRRCVRSCESVMDVLLP